MGTADALVAGSPAAGTTRSGAARSTVPHGEPAASARPEPNHLLGLLARDQYEALRGRTDMVRLAAGDVLFEAGRPIMHVHFPQSGEFSVVKTMRNGTEVEVVTVGREGMVGLDVFLGGATTPLRCFTQLAGATLRLGVEDFREMARDGAPLHRIMQHYAQAIYHQIAQTVACNRLHSVEHRCARWLLMTHDRAGGEDSFALTHEFLAVMLGVRRAGVTVAEGKLRRAGLIRYRRGHVTIVDRVGLEAVACECYRSDRENFERLLGVEDRPAPVWHTEGGVS